MPTDIDLFLAKAYLFGLSVLAVGTAILPRHYLNLGVFVFIVALFVGLGWGMTDADGPSGFGVLAVYGFIYLLFVLSHAIRIGYGLLQKASSLLEAQKPADQTDGSKNEF